jgi:hypothetical protein
LGKHYVHSVRRFELYDIEITEVKKYAGHYFNPTLVRGVVDLSNNSLTKFYIAESDVPELEALIRSGGRKDDYLVGGKNPEWYKNL